MVAFFAGIKPYFSKFAMIVFRPTHSKEHGWKEECTKYVSNGCENNFAFFLAPLKIATELVLTDYLRIILVAPVLFFLSLAQQT